jgi:2-iminobutanoate/2-iminopropanoate deaminase
MTLDVSETPARREYLLPDLTTPISHYAHAVSFGNLLFISGVVGVNPEDMSVSPDVAQQARHLFLNMSKVLVAAGATFADILKVTVFLTNVSDHALVTPVRAEFFGAHRPASTLVEVSSLVRPGLKVEVEAIAGLSAR